MYVFFHYKTHPFAYANKHFNMTQKNRVAISRNTVLIFLKKYFIFL